MLLRNACHPYIAVLLNLHYENKFTKTFRPTNILHIFTKFFIMIFFVTNQLNISKFLSLQLRKTLISY